MAEATLSCSDLICVAGSSLGLGWFVFVLIFLFFFVLLLFVVFLLLLLLLLLLFLLILLLGFVRLLTLTIGLVSLLFFSLLLLFGALTILILLLSVYRRLRVRAILIRGRLLIVYGRLRRAVVVLLCWAIISVIFRRCICRRLTGTIVVRLLLRISGGLARAIRVLRRWLTRAVIVWLNVGRLARAIRIFLGRLTGTIIVRLLLRISSGLAGAVRIFLGRLLTWAIIVRLLLGIGSGLSRAIIIFRGLTGASAVSTVLTIWVGLDDLRRGGFGRGRDLYLRASGRSFGAGGRDLTRLRYRDRTATVGFNRFLALRKGGWRRRRSGFCNDGARLNGGRRANSHIRATTEDRFTLRDGRGSEGIHWGRGDLTGVDADHVARNRLTRAEGLRRSGNDCARHALIYVGHIVDGGFVDHDSVVVIVYDGGVHRSVGDIHVSYVSAADVIGRHEDFTRTEREPTHSHGDATTATDRYSDAKTRSANPRD